MTRLGNAAQSIVLADPGWINPVVVPVSGPRASWQTSTIGVWSGHVPAWRAHATGLGSLLGKWLRWDHPTMGPWGGVVKRTPGEVSAGTIEISADSFHCLLKGVATPVSLKTATGSPGSLALRLLTICGTDRWLGFDAIAADSGGAVTRLDLRGDDLYDVIGSLAESNGHEWDVTLNDDGTIELAFRLQIGSDRTGSVILSDGRNLVGGTITVSIDGLVNDILAVEDTDEWSQAKKKRVLDSDSIQAWQRSSTTRRYAAAPGIASLAARARADLAIDSLPVVAPSVTVPGNDPVLRSIRQGDTVRLWSARQNQRLFFRVVSRSIDENDLAQLAGDAIDEDEAA